MALTEEDKRWLSEKFDHVATNVKESLERAIHSFRDEVVSRFDAQKARLEKLDRET